MRFTICDLRFAILSGVMAAAVGTWAADVLPTDWQQPWDTMGIPGGIPRRPTEYTNIAAYTGNADQINTALVNCPSNQFVRLGTGQFRLSAQIVFNNKAGVELRGTITGSNSKGDRRDASKSTVIVFTASPPQEGHIQFLGQNTCDFSGIPGTCGAFTNWTAGYTKGTTTITLQGAPSGLVVNDLMYLDQVNNNKWVGRDMGEGCSDCGRDSATRSMSQIVLVTNISGSQVNFTPGLYATNWNDHGAADPEAYWRPNPTRWCSVSDLTISNTTSGFHCSIGGRNFIYCGATNVHTYDGPRAHIRPEMSYGFQAQYCFAFGTLAAASQSYGVELRNCSQVLLIDNIYEGVASPIITGHTMSGAMVGYNFSTNNTYTPSTWQQHSATHASHTYGLYWAGNWFGSGIYHDAIHGSGSHNVALRNRLMGNDEGRTDNRGVVQIEHTNYFHSYIGNILGRDGVHNVYTETNEDSSVDCIFRLGHNANGVGNWDTNVMASVMRKDNYNTVNDAIPGSESPGGDTYPNCYAFSSKPAWFRNRPWPAYHAPDATSANIATTGDPQRIPAGYRFWNNMEDPPFGSEHHALRRPEGRGGAGRRR